MPHNPLGRRRLTCGSGDDDPRPGVPVPVHALSRHDEVGDDQQDAEAEARPMIADVIDPSSQLAHIPVFLLTRKMWNDSSIESGRRVL